MDVLVTYVSLFIEEFLDGHLALDPLFRGEAINMLRWTLAGSFVPNLQRLRDFD